MLENLRFSLNGIRTHKLRSFLTMLGVIIGIASIIAIVSIVTGTNQKLEQNLIGSGNNVTPIGPVQDGFAYDMSWGSIPAGVPVVSEDAMDRVRAIDGVEAATAYTARQGSSEIYYQDNTLGGAYLYGVDTDYLTTYRYKISTGRTFTDSELSAFSKTAMLSKSAAETLFGTDDPLGKTIEISREPFVVIGVFYNPYTSERTYDSIEEYYQYGYDNAGGEVLIPQKAWPILYQFDEPQTVAIRTAETSRMAGAATEAAAILNESVTNEKIRYGALNLQENNDSLKTLTDSIQMMLLAIASLSLLVGGIGVMNIMLVSVTERTTEIGLKKALGAKRSVILGQFLTESAMLTLIGGVIGVLVGVGAAWVISYIAQLKFAVSVPWMIISVAFSIVIGVIFGAVPAYRAAKLDPIEALRRE